MYRRTLPVLAVVVGAVLIVGLVGASNRRQERSKPSAELGGHLVTIMGCNDCHTPFVLGADGPQPDMTRMLSGHPAELEMPAPPALGDGPWMWVGAATNTAFAGPWGVSYAINLTPHETTGMGIWTEQMFVDAMRTGRHMGQSRMIRPPMPWPAYSRMTDRELRSVFSYLRTIPPLENLVPDAVEPSAMGVESAFSRGS